MILLKMSIQLSKIGEIVYLTCIDTFSCMIFMDRFMMSVCKSMSSDNGCGAETSICATGSDGVKHAIGATNTQTAKTWGM